MIVAENPTDDDDDSGQKFLGFGAASTTDRRKPSKKEREEIAEQEPIGFVHFRSPIAKDLRTPKYRKRVVKSKKVYSRKRKP